MFYKCQCGGFKQVPPYRNNMEKPFRTCPKCSPKIGWQVNVMGVRTNNKPKFVLPKSVGKKQGFTLT